MSKWQTISLFLYQALCARIPPPTKGQTTSRKFLTLSIFFLLSFFCTTNLWGAEDEIDHEATQSDLNSTATNVWKDFNLTGASGATYMIHSLGTKNTSNALQWNANGYLYQEKSGGKLKSVTIKGTSGKSVKIYASTTAYTAKASGTAITTLNLTGNDAIYTFAANTNYTYLAINGNASATAITHIIVTYETATTYTVTYDKNGATSGNVPTDANSPYEENAEVTVLGNTGNLAKTGYTFGGWNTKSDGTGTNYTAGSGTFNITGNTTLYVQWTVNTHTLNWDVNEGNALTGTYTQGNVAYGATITKPSNPTRTGHTFKGWSIDGTNIVTPASTMPDNDLTYIALWTPLPQYTVTWSVDGQTTTEQVYKGSKPTNAPTIDENNLPCEGADKFVGWTTGEYKGDTAPGTLYPTANDIPAITEDKTFYAVFADYE